MTREAEFLRIISADPDIAALVRAMATFDAPDCWLVSGVLFQTVWNAIEGRPQGHGIDDFDLFYFDDDLSLEAEARWIAKANVHFASARRPVQLRNQARVHLWYRDKFGVPDYPRLGSSCDGVRHFLIAACMVAVRPKAGSMIELYAPVGLDDVFDRVVRPNPLWAQVPLDAYAAKVARYKRDWPSVREIGS